MENVSEKIQKQLETLEIVILNVADIKPDPENPKDHSAEQIEKLCRSMETAWTNPIIVDENNVVIAGHGRLMAAQKLKLDRVPCIVLTGLTPAEKIQLQIFDNKSGEMSIWNIDKLCIKIDQLRDMNADLDLTGFTEKEISDIFDEQAEQQPDEIQEQMDSVPATPEKPQTKAGDVWTIGRHKLHCYHKLICGDSTSADDLKKLMDGELADMMVTDPPYNVDIENSAGLKIMNDHKDDGQNFYDFDDGLFAKPLPEFDLIVSNPPFHNKAKLVEKIINIGKPFALLLPMTWLNDCAPYRLFARGGVEIMLFDRRVHFKNCGSQPSFGVGYYCRGILPEKIIWESLGEQ